jgi:hypothetical protein
VVALATLVPEEGIGKFYLTNSGAILLNNPCETDELDSYLYQPIRAFEMYGLPRDCLPV